jgi:hypothetical protein
MKFGDLVLSGAVVPTSEVRMLSFGSLDDREFKCKMDGWTSLTWCLYHTLMKNSSIASKEANIANMNHEPAFTFEENMLK